NTHTLYLDLEIPSDPTIDGQEKRVYTLSAAIRPAASQANITLSISSENDFFVDKLDATVVQVYPLAKPYPYNSSVIRVVSSDLASSFYSYPNPFAAGREKAGIQYYLAGSSKVSLYIFDLIGRKVRTLAEAEDQAGGVIYRREWDGQNDSGKTVLNGVYYGVLYVDGKKHMTKIAVVK
ncbi:MAG TPA: FlgD immunoglobulin-like domain containing protein, partial [Candidatus Goldiibacteriota bacterium]|nr:FlgD immunoglobulin-like domain containing protein [Candidatus Goldiibacteriota bacterium]